MTLEQLTQHNQRPLNGASIGDRRRGKRVGVMPLDGGEGGDPKAGDPKGGHAQFLKKRRGDEPTSGLSISSAVTEFMLHQRVSRHSPRTVEYYVFCLTRFSKWVAGQGIEYVEDIDAGCIRLFMCELEDTMKPNSVHAIMRAVRALFNFIEREELIGSNPMRKIRMPKTDKLIMPAFTEDEIASLLKGCSGKEPLDVRNRALVLLLLDSGLRLAECASLKLSDVDIETGVIHVIGKGRKERVTKLGASSLKAMHRYLRVRTGEPGEALWVGRRGAMTAYGIAETLEKLGKATGVHAHPHKFRRTCALMLLRNGADVFSVQYLLGHSDLGVLRRYLAQTDRDVTKAHTLHSPVDGMR